MSMFFDSWIGLGRTALVGTLAYLGLVFMLRISGKRTLAKMNSFDLVVTVALGSTLSSILLSQDVPLAEGLTAFAVLIVMQFVITWLSVRSSFIRQAVRSEPGLLFFRGQFLEDAMRSERVTRSELLQAIRSQGTLSLENVEAVVMETDGTMAIVSRGDADAPSSLQNIRTSRES